MFAVLLMYASLTLLTRGLPRLRAVLIYAAAAVIIGGLTWVERRLGRRLPARRGVRQQRDHLLAAPPPDYQI